MESAVSGAKRGWHSSSNGGRPKRQSHAPKQVREAQTFRKINSLRSMGTAPRRSREKGGLVYNYVGEKRKKKKQTKDIAKTTGEADVKENAKIPYCDGEKKRAKKGTPGGVLVEETIVNANEAVTSICTAVLTGKMQPEKRAKKKVKHVEERAARENLDAEKGERTLAWHRARGGVLRQEYSSGIQKRGGTSPLNATKSKHN